MTLRSQYVRRTITAAAAMLAAMALVLTPPSVSNAALSDPGGPGTQIDPPPLLDGHDSRDFSSSGTYSWVTTGRNVHAYVLGDLIHTSHTTFGGRASLGADFTGGTTCGLPHDNLGTGLASAVGGTRHGVAKEVRLVGVRIADCKTTTTSSRLVQGLDWVAANAVRPAVAVLNITHGADPEVDAAALRLINSGVVLVSTAGFPSMDGQHKAKDVSPGRVPEVITVAQSWGAVDARLTMHGPPVDLFASYTTMAIGRGSSEYAPSLNAAGLVAGAAALVLSLHPEWTPAQVGKAITDHATRDLVRNVPEDTPNLLLYLGQ